MKRIRSVSALCLVFVILASASVSFAAERLEIVQARQAEDQLILYTLLTDADSGTVISPDFSSVQVSAGAQGGTVVNTTAFRNTGESVAYAVVLDLNSYALNANRIKSIQDAIKVLLNGMRSGDRMMLITAGQKEMKVLTNGFEKDLLKLNSTIEGITNAGRGTSTVLYRGLERALTGFSATEKDFPERKVIVVFGYGADNSGVAADVIAEKAGASGIPAYFITMKGSYEGKRRNADTTDLDRIARASHGRVLNGHEDLMSAVTLLREYVASTAVLTIKPNQAAWSGLTGRWRVSAAIGGHTISNDGDMDYYFALQPTPTPMPVKMPTKEPATPLPPTATPSATPATQSATASAASPEPTEAPGPLSALADKLTTPPLLYVSAGVGILLAALLILLITHQVKKSRAQRAEERKKLEEVNKEPEEFVPVKDSNEAGLGGKGEGTQGLWDEPNGEKTIDVFHTDPEATLGMDQYALKLQAHVTYQGQQRTVPVRLTKEVKFGRDKSCEIALDDPHVSRKHGKLTLKPDGLYVSDMGSMSGTALNGQPVTAETAVRNGDIITVGTTTIQLEILS